VDFQEFLGIFRLLHRQGQVGDRGGVVTLGQEVLSLLEVGLLPGGRRGRGGVGLLLGEAAEQGVESVHHGRVLVRRGHGELELVLHLGERPPRGEGSYDVLEILLFVVKVGLDLGIAGAARKGDHEPRHHVALELGPEDVTSGRERGVCEPALLGRLGRPDHVVGGHVFQIYPGALERVALLVDDNAGHLRNHLGGRGGGTEQENGQSEQNRPGKEASSLIHLRSPGAGREQVSSPASLY
jgi:hypothetical protein